MRIAVETENVAPFFVHGRTAFFTTLDNKRYIVDDNTKELRNMLDPAAFFRGAVHPLHDCPDSRLRLLLNPPFEEPGVAGREKAQRSKPGQEVALLDGQGTRFFLRPSLR